MGERDRGKEGVRTGGQLLVTEDQSFLEVVNLVPMVEAKQHQGVQTESSEAERKLRRAQT